MAHLTTLHVNLMHTTIEDFAEHFEQSITNIVRWGRLDGTEIDSYGTILWDASQIDEGLQVGLIQGPRGKDYQVRWQHSISGNTSHTWLCLWSGRNGGFVLGAQRFRRDCIKLYMREFHEAPVYAPMFRGWLNMRWDDAVKECPLKNAPVTAYKALPTTPPVPGADGYTWDDLFDWWYRGGRLFGYQNQSDLERAIPNARGTINNRIAAYKAQYGASGMPDKISKFAGMVPIVNIVHDDE